YLRVNNISLIIKAHQNEPSGNLAWFKDFASRYNDIVLFYASEIDLYNLILRSDLVIGYYSTALLEAIALNVPVITIATDNIPRGIHSYLENNKLEDVIKLSSSLENTI